MRPNQILLCWWPILNFYNQMSSGHKIAVMHCHSTAVVRTSRYSPYMVLISFDHFSLFYRRDFDFLLLISSILVNFYDFKLVWWFFIRWCLVRIFVRNDMKIFWGSKLRSCKHDYNIQSFVFIITWLYDQIWHGIYDVLHAIYMSTFIITNIISCSYRLTLSSHRTVHFDV